MQQDKHNVSQSMHRVQTCGEYDKFIEHDMYEHNQQIWRCWCTKARCRSMSGVSKVHPTSASAPQCEGPCSQSPMLLLRSRDVSCRQQEGNNNERVTHPICVFEDDSNRKRSPFGVSQGWCSCASCMPSHNQVGSWCYRLVNPSKWKNMTNTRKNKWG